MDIIDKLFENHDLNILKKLTIIIPTYNRNYYLSRCLWYHAHFPFGQIIVADSSPDEKKKVNYDTVKRIEKKFGKEILYLESKPECEKYGDDIAYKWNSAINKAKCDYIQLRTDKEFSNPVTIAHCISFLEKNPQYICASGINYSITSNCKQQPTIENYGSTISITADSIRERLEIYLSSPYLPTSTQFSVQRTNIFKTLYSNVLKYNIADMRFGETAVEIQPIIIGKTKTFAGYISSYRDNIHYQLPNMKTGGCTESSSTRYPLPYDYPKEYLNEKFVNLAKLFLELIDDPNHYNYQECLKLAKHVIYRRYFPLKTPYKFTPINLIQLIYPIIKFFWYAIPNAIRRYIYMHFLTKRNDGLENSVVHDEIIKTILNITNETTDYQENDKAIDINRW